jgi:DNA repair ATPase RecN
MNLGILAGINGTLDFSQLQAVKQLESNMSVLETNLENLSSSIDAIDRRLAPLEGLTGRMTTIEDVVETVREDVDDALRTVDLMQSDLDDLSVETARLSGRVDLFDTFLDGLRSLINEIFALPSPETLPES